MSIENAGAIDANTIVEMTPEQADQAWNDVAAERADPLAGGESTTAAEQVKEEPVAKDPILVRLEAQDELIKKLHNDLKMASGRVSKIQGELDAGRAAAKAVKDAPTTAQQTAAAADPAKWAALKEEFPEWTDAIGDQINARIADATRSLQLQDPTELVDLDAVLRQRETQRVLRTHKDFFETIKSTEFVEWRKGQPAEVNALGASDLAEDAIEMVNLFKAAKAEPAKADALEASRAALLKRASAPSPRATAPVKNSGGELTPQQIWAQEAADRAKRKAA